MEQQFTADQLRQYKDYERVRKGGRFNMLDPQARKATGLDREDYTFVLRNYSALRAASEASPSTTADAGVVG